METIRQPPATPWRQDEQEVDEGRGACAYSSVNSPPCRAVPTTISQPNPAEGYQVMKNGKPTASTRNNDVFPAFCNPTMVTSISIALASPVRIQAQGSRRGRRASSGPSALRRSNTMLPSSGIAGPASAPANSYYSPERPQQPVIHLPK